MQHPAYLQFWGKAQGALPDNPLTWHPLAYHCLDVAAVADELLRQNPRRLAAMARLADTADVDAFRNFLIAMIALHDIGKFATTFQAKAPDAWPVTVLGAYPRDPRTDGDHALLASQARLILGLKPALNDWVGMWSTHEPFETLWHAVAGHHGRPKVGDLAIDASDMWGAFPPTTVTAAGAFRDDVLSLFPERTLLPSPKPGDHRLRILSWAVAGLAVAADWIGSRRDWFPYAEAECSIAEYWAQSLKKAKTAVALAGILSVPANPDLQIEDLLPADKKPSPLQQLLADTDLPNGPTLTIVEDVTGSGKTEAALMLAARLVADGRASGLFFALPTMATANAMYERMHVQYRRIFADGAAPSLVLAHGKRGLNDKFEASIMGIDEASRTTDTGDHDEDGAAICSAWLADDRRKALLAHIGVGTIDQALLAVLPSKFQSLRLWGLADKVLVLDEVHAFDAYMNREIETLLEFHAALGGSAILLSATLPARQRAALEAAFARGIGRAGSGPAIGEAPYPLVTMVSSAGTVFGKPETRADRTRVVAVRRIGVAEEAVAHIATIAAGGGCVAWIRNSVDDAIEAVEMVRAHDATLKPVLLHARFAMGDRLNIEKLVRETLGPGENAAARHRYVLIGTQILEASLDYDVDAMITDIAPIDLIIQRAGRLWRHADRARRPIAKPLLMILSSAPTNDADAKWYEAVSQRGAWVYKHHGIVWRSAAKLFEEQEIATPGGVRELIEAVYGRERDDIDDVPKALRAASAAAFGEDMAAQTFARANLLELLKGYAGNHTIWTQDTLTPTRLGNPVTLFRLGKWHGARIVPYYGDGETLRNWALSEVSVATSKARGVLITDAATELAICEAKKAWPTWERDTALLILKPDCAAWTGTVTKDATTPLSIRYCRDLGFRLI